MLCITIHSNLMTFNKIYKTKTVTLYDLIGESSPHLLDTYIHSHLFLNINYLLFIIMLWIVTSKNVPMNTNITFNYEVPYM